MIMRWVCRKCLPRGDVLLKRDLVFMMALAMLVQMKDLLSLMLLARKKNLQSLNLN